MIGIYDNRIESIPFNQLNKVLDQLEFGSGDVEVSISKQQLIVEVKIDDNEIDLKMLNHQEFESNYGYKFGNEVE